MTDLKNERGPRRIENIGACTWQIWKLAERIIEPERIKAIQESICGFLLDEVINPKGEFYVDPTISVCRLDWNMSDEEDN